MIINGAAPPPLVGALPVAQASVAAPLRLPVYVACTLLVLVTNYLIGKEMAWDVLSYHLYSGFSAVHDRFSQDYFAAGPQSYFNPYAYVPFYALVSAGFPALVVGSILACLHSVILWLTFELAMTVCPWSDARVRLLFGICAVALAFINPILMQQLGSSFTDITTGELVLGGWLLLTGAVRTPRLARSVFAGLLLGTATALKPTNAVHAIAAFTLLPFIPIAPRGRLRHAIGYAFSLGLGFAIFTLPWSYRLEHMFGNPFFPLLNGVFRSPEFTTEPLRHFRFVPDSLGAALWRPFAMIDPTRMVHEELSAPDLRYAALVILTVAYGVLWWRRRPAAPERGTLDSAAAARALAAMGCGLAVDWVLWLSGSGNSRYFLPMSSVAAVAIAGVLFRLCADRPRLRNYMLAGIFAAQAVQLWMGTEYRWTAAPWGGPWFNFAIPAKLTGEPNLYLTIGAQTNSFIAPFLAPGSGLTNVAGGYALAREGANGERVETLIRRYAAHLRVLTNGARLYADEEHRLPRRSNIDDVLEDFGLRVDPSDCSTITVYGLPADPEITFKSSETVEPQRRDNTYLVSCRVAADDTDRSSQIARRRAADLVFDRLEDACPELFQPRRPATEHEGDSWRRTYINTDITAWISYGGVKFRDPTRGDRSVLVGREDDWTKAPQRLACGRHNGHYFAKVL